MNSREALWTLHLLDVAIAEREAAAAALSSEVEGAARLAELRQRLETLRQRAQQVRSAQRTAELELESLRAKRRRLEQELYSGRFTNPRELMNLQRELEALASQYAQLESWILEQMAEAEDVDRELEELDDQLRDLEAAYRMASEDRAARCRALEAELAGLRQRRAEQVAAMDPEVVERYERLRGRLHPPVARLVGEACGGCHVTLASGFRERVRSQDGRAVACPACGRLLVP
jgi:predicted  nucleic acid-binding Zn-ribbon protein